MKRGTLLTSILIGMFLCTFPAVLQAQEIQGQLSFSPEDLKFETRSGFDLVSFFNADYTLQVGAPHLPQKHIDIAIPTDAEVLAVNVLGKEMVEIAGSYNLMPNAGPVQCSAPAPVDPFVKDPAVYGKDALYPGTIAEAIATWDYVGQDFVTLSIYPVQYNPSSQKIYLVTHLEFEVVYREAALPYRETYNFSEKVRNFFNDMLKSMAFNPIDVDPIPQYIAPAMAGLTPGNFEYVIITTTTFESAFQPLADWRTQMGIPATTVDKIWIYANYSGANNQEKIRNFLIDANTTWGSIYFLLGGDTSYIPYHLKNINGTNIPNDTYDSDYDDDWKCELFVGRACVNTTAQVSTFVNKVLTYEKNPPDNYGNKVFFMGFDLDSSTPTEKIKQNIKDSWVSPNALFVREWDSEAGGHETDVKTYMNQGQHLVNHSDHADTDLIGVGSIHHNTYITGTEAKNFTNGTKYSNFYTIGCWAGNYPSSCWGEKFVRDDQGGITFVGNSRYGWYQPGAYASYSLKYDHKWWEVLYSFNFYNAGITLAKSLNKYYPFDSTCKYIFTELNLFGDPALHLWTDNPTDPTVLHDISISLGSQTFQVTVTDGANGIEEALVCVMKGTEVYAYGTTDATGTVVLSIDPATTGTMTVTATAENFKYYEGSVDVQAGVYPPTISDITPGYGLEAGSTPVTVTGTHFTSNPATTVRINGIDCTSITVVNATTITCLTPAGTNGWYDVEVANTSGSDLLTGGFRFFPTGGAPFNAMDVPTDSLDAPVMVTLLLSGQPADPFFVFFSFGDGPVSTKYGIMGLDFPIYSMINLVLNGQGYFALPFSLTPGYGPLDLYMHTLGLDALGKPKWAYGGNTTNGSGSVWLHLNN